MMIAWSAATQKAYLTLTHEELYQFLYRQQTAPQFLWCHSTPEGTLRLYPDTMKRQGRGDVALLSRTQVILQLPKTLPRQLLKREALESAFWQESITLTADTAGKL